MPIVPIGRTPSDEALEVPPCLFWPVQPVVGVDMENVGEEIEAREIPGLRMERARHDDLARLMQNPPPFPLLALLALLPWQLTQIAQENRA